MGGRAGAGRATTRTAQVYGQLRADILAGVLQPGARLPFAELSARYQSSTSAIREGLQRLVEQGLVTSEPQLGFRVATLSIADLQDLTIARCEIEGLALRYSIEHGDLAWEAGVVAAWHTLERTPLGSAAADGHALAHDWSSAHAAFHESLIAGCPNRRILATASSLRAAAELYRHWSWRADGFDRDVVAEHQSLVDAVLQRAAERAIESLHDHLTTTTRLLVVAHQHADDPDNRRSAAGVPGR